MLSTPSRRIGGALRSIALRRPLRRPEVRDRRQVIPGPLAIARPQTSPSSIALRIVSTPNFACRADRRSWRGACADGLDRAQRLIRRLVPGRGRSRRHQVTMRRSSRHQRPRRGRSRLVLVTAVRHRRPDGGDAIVPYDRRCVPEPPRPSSRVLTKRMPGMVAVGRARVTGDRNRRPSSKRGGGTRWLSLNWSNIRTAYEGGRPFGPAGAYSGSTASPASLSIGYRDNRGSSIPTERPARLMAHYFR
jgi:hypothetical protein